jgi:hypothetical protein
LEKPIYYYHFGRADLLLLFFTPAAAGVWPFTIPRYNPPPKHLTLKGMAWRERRWYEEKGDDEEKGNDMKRKEVIWRERRWYEEKGMEWRERNGMKRKEDELSLPPPNIKKTRVKSRKMSRKNRKTNGSAEKLTKIAEKLMKRYLIERQGAHFWETKNKNWSENYFETENYTEKGESKNWTENWTEKIGELNGEDRRIKRRI